MNMTDVWGHASSSDSEEWAGNFATREEAISEGESAYDGTPFYVTRGRMWAATDFLPGVDDIINGMNERACDESGTDAAEEYPDVPEEGRSELDAMLAAWAAKWARPTFWTAIGQPERIEPKASSACPFCDRPAARCDCPIAAPPDPLDDASADAFDPTPDPEWNDDLYWHVEEP